MPRFDNKTTFHKAITGSEATPEAICLSRRGFMLGMGAFLASTSLAGSADQALAAIADRLRPFPLGNGRRDELGNPLSSYREITFCNNLDEFSASERAVAGKTGSFEISPAVVKVGGLVRRPKAYSVDELLAKFTQEERIYRLRSVQGWSLVVPWVGFSLAALIKEVEPLPGARFVRFETADTPAIMKKQRQSAYNVPYAEGLRLDEAMHELTIMATGIGGKPLPPRNGLPIQLVVPWKYSFKSIKSILRIDLVDTMPITSRMSAAPREYGFYANVNPEVDHPRWSQAREKRGGELFRRHRTLMFNGYGEQVAHLYRGMDLHKYF